MKKQQPIIALDGKEYFTLKAIQDKFLENASSLTIFEIIKFKTTVWDADAVFTLSEKSLPKLTQLSIRTSEMAPRNIGVLLSAAPEIETLDLREWNRTNPINPNLKSMQLKPNSLLKLKFINIDCAKLDFLNFEMLLCAAPNLTYLSYLHSQLIFNDGLSENDQKNALFGTMNRLANAGNIFAKRFLASDYETGKIFGKVNLPFASMWYKNAGDESKGQVLEDLMDVEFKIAFKASDEMIRLHKSAIANDIDAANALSEAFELGRGVRRDLYQALLYASLAGNEEHAEALSNQRHAEEAVARQPIVV